MTVIVMAVEKVKVAVVVALWFVALQIVVAVLQGSS